MHLFQAIIRNITLIKYHILYFLLKFLIIFAAFRPLQEIFERFLQTKTVNQSLFENSDVNVLFEFYIYVLKSEIDIVLVSSFFVFIVYILIDVIFEMAFFRSYSKVDHSDFFSGINLKLGQFFLLKILAIIPYVIMLFVYSFILFTVYTIYPGELWVLTLVFILLSPLLFLILKIIDWAKIDLLVTKDSFLKAIGHSVVTMFHNFKDILFLNVKMAVILAIGTLIYLFIDSNFNQDSKFTVLIMAIIFEFVIFAKQILRYSYAGSIIQIYEASENKKSELIAEN
jgi:hypothetical protein